MGEDAGKAHGVSAGPQICQIQRIKKERISQRISSLFYLYRILHSGGHAAFLFNFRLQNPWNFGL